LFCLALAVGCGVDVVGVPAPMDGGPSVTTPPSTSPGTTDAAPVLTDSGADGSIVTPGDSGTDGDAPSDGGVDAPVPCLPTVIDDPLTTLDLSRWIKVSNDAAYPTVEEPPSQNVAMVVLLDMQQARRSGFWLKDPVPTRAFDVSFKYLVLCPMGNHCGDGFGVGWYNTTSPADLANADTGGGLGMPKTPGGALTISLLKNFQSNDTIKPVTQQILSVTNGLPGVVSTTSSSDAYVRELRTVTLRLRSGVLAVTNAGASSSQSTSGATTSSFTGMFGFHAGTGGDTGGFYIGSFHGEFYACDPP
jgi:hypothetical protein